MGGISSSWRRQDNEMENLEKQQTTKTDQQGIQRIEKAVEPNSLGLNPTLLISCVIDPMSSQGEIYTVWLA